MVIICLQLVSQRIVFLFYESIILQISWLSRLRVPIPYIYIYFLLGKRLMGEISINVNVQIFDDTNVELEAWVKPSNNSKSICEIFKFKVNSLIIITYII